MQKSWEKFEILIKMSKSCTYFYERKIIKIEDYELQQQKNYIELKPILLESYLPCRKKYWTTIYTQFP